MALMLSGMVATFPIAVFFGNPALLWGGCLVALPLLLQLFLRRKYRDEPWGAMRFLRRAVERQRQRLQWEQWLQLLVRMALIAVVVAALARPFSERAEVAESAAPGGIQYIIVWDSSLSMRANLGTETAFEQGRSKILQLLQQAPPGSTVRLLRNTSHVDRVLIARPMLDFEAVRLELELLTPTLDRGDWLTTLDDVTALLEQNSGARSAVVLVTDLQVNEWGISNADRAALRAQLRKLRQQAELTLINVGSAVENQAVTRLEVRPGWLAAQGSATAHVRVANYGQQAKDVQLDLIVDDHPQRRETVCLDPGEERDVDVPLSIILPGEHVVEAQIGEDALLEDNRRIAILPATAAVQVLLIENADGEARRQTSDYLRLVFGNGGASSLATLSSESQYVLQVAAPQELAALNFARYDAILLSDVVELPPEQQARLRQFVQQGGGLMQIAGSRWTTSSAAQWADWQLTLDESVTMPDEATAPFLLEAAQQNHPLIAVFQDHPEAGLETTRVYRYVRVSATRADWEVVLRYSSLDAAVLARTSGAGRCLLVTTSLNDAWGSWVLWPSFVPFIRESIDYLVAGRFERPALTLGEPWHQAAQSNEVDANDLDAPLLTLPDQRTAFAELQFDSNEWIFAGTTQPGAYTVTLGRESRRFAVNLDPLEFDTRGTTVAQLEQDILKGITLNNDWEQSAMASTTESQADWTVPLLVLGFGLWVCEYLLQRAYRVALALLLGLICSVVIFALLAPPLSVLIALCGLISALQLLGSRLAHRRSSVTAAP